MNNFNQLRKFSPLLLALPFQFLFQDYSWIVISTILAGFVAQLLTEDKRLFLKVFIIELVIFALIFMYFSNRISYLDHVFQNLRLPEFLIGGFFVAFNALNIATLFFMGYKVSSLIIKRNS
jgi:hypothetical protein